jgi:hypothetical protein
LIPLFWGHIQTRASAFGTASRHCRQPQIGHAEQTFPSNEQVLRF